MTIIISLLILVLSGCALVDNGTVDDAADNTDTANAGSGTDYEALINEVTKRAALFNVKVIAEYTSLRPMGFGAQEISTGSGVIYRKDSGYYYALTNNHVVTADKSAYRSKYYVHDAYGNAYEASLIATDETCDLALIAFKGSADIELGVVEFAEENASVDEKIISLGNPGGQFNSITLGKILGTREVEPNNEENKIYFPVTVHTAPLDHGSSGGALINYELKLVGINYAMGNSEGADMEFGLAIPLDKVVAFLEKFDSGFASDTEAEP